MAQNAYTNPINEMEVSIAIERLLIANYPNTTFLTSPGRIDVGSPPPSFFDLGAVVEDSPAFKVSREVFALETGIPKVTQYQAVTGLNGEFSVALHSSHWRKAQLALGNYSYTTSVTTIGSISSVVNRTRVVLTCTGSAPHTNGATIGRQIVLNSSGNQDNIDAIETWIASISTVASGSYDVTFGTVPVRTPTAGQLMWKYDLSRLLVGSSQIKTYVLLGVADFVDGTQIVHHFPKVQPMGEFNENIQPGQNQRTSLSWKAFGIPVTDPLGAQELAVAERFYFPKGTNLASY